MKKIFPVVLVVILIISGLTGCAKRETILANPPEPPKPSLPPEFFLDSDGDGFNDWFETNIAHYNPSIPNDRYIIVFHWFDDSPHGFDEVIKEQYDFFVKNEKIPPENIIQLTNGETATATNFENAIDRVAAKADRNDLVFIQITTHAYTIGGFSPSGNMVEAYQMIDSWLDKINAMAVIITVTSCLSEKSDYPLFSGSCPRVVYTWSCGEFVGALGKYPDYAEVADRKYGNGNGYVSLDEIGNWIDNDPKWGPDWAELHENGRGHLQALGWSKVTDNSNIASRIYFTDFSYKP